MKDLDWNDLRYILYLSRTGRVASTARMLGVNETTVVRRIAHVERLLGVRLFERNARVLAPTENGQLVISHTAPQLFGACSQYRAGRTWPASRVSLPFSGSSVPAPPRFPF
jgi:DNA-binding transcriptional LysR family regulator